MNWILGTHAKVKQRTNTMLFPSGPRMHTVAHTIIMNKKQGLKINNVVHAAQPWTLMKVHQGNFREDKRYFLTENSVYFLKIAPSDQ